jgi:S-adenosylmethionine synthetase
MLFDSSRYSVESVLQGHPDKVCDQVADSILDAFLQDDADAMVAVECLGCGDELYLAGEVSTKVQIDVERIARDVYRDIGYSQPLKVASHIQAQSSQLRRAVDSGTAGDQGIMYGYACNSGYNFLPYGVFLVSALAKAIDALRHRTQLFLPDGKVQASICDGMIETLVISVQHESEADMESLRDAVLKDAVNPIAPIKAIKKVMFNHN